jgi:hypothetical protein
MKTAKTYSFILVVVVIFVIAFYSYFILGNQARSTRALTKGGQYVATMYGDYAVAGKSCQGEDSDNNGYVTCNFRIKKGEPAQEKTITLQCPTFIKSFLATSCKEQGIVINQQ